jgi:hypothetical protein
MATSSSWRTNNGPRWSQGPGQNNNSSSNHQSGGGAANTPRSASNNVVRPSAKAAAAVTPTPGAFPPLGAKGSAPLLDEADSIQSDRVLYLLVGLVVSSFANPHP